MSGLNFHNDNSTEVVTIASHSDPATVNSIPFEILVHIFQSLQDLTGWTKHWADKKTRSVPWIQVTWVSKRWRAVALATPVLWNKVADPDRNLSFDWTPVFLLRAAGAPLDVNVKVQKYSPTMGLNRSRDSLILQHLPSYASSIRYFRVDVAGDNPESRSLAPLFLHVLKEMSSLESLYLQDHRFSGLYTGRAAFTTFPQLLPAHIPHLRSLTLVGVCFPWSSPVYTMGLRFLAIKACEVSVSTSQLLHILRSSPDLDTLHLESQCLPPDGSSTIMDSDRPERSTPVLLPKLQSLYLHGRPECIHSVCDSILAPSLRTVKFYYSLNPDPFVDALREVVPSHRLVRPLLTQATRLSLHVKPFNDFRLALYPTDADEPAENGPVLIEITQQLDEDYPITPAGWHALLDVLAPAASRLTSLTLRDLEHTWLTREMWAQFFARVPLLAHLDLGYCELAFEAQARTNGLAAVLDLLRRPRDSQEGPGVEPREEPDSEGGRGVCCPRLRVLALRCGSYVDGSAADELRAALEWRAPLCELVLTPTDAGRMQWPEERLGGLVRVTIRPPVLHDDRLSYASFRYE